MNKDLKITISVDKKTGAIKAVDGEMKELLSSTTKANKNIGLLRRDILGLVSVAGAIYTIKQAFDVVSSSIMSLTRTAGNFESQKSILATLEGDAQKAEKSFEWVKQFAKDTPYEMEKVLESFVRAKSYGIDPTNGSLIALGDAAAGMKKDITQAVEAMADAMTGENERLKEFGIRARVEGENITYNWTSSSGKVKSTTIKNNTEIIQSTLQTIFNSKYKGAMKNMMTTYDGMVSNMSDNWTNYKDRLARESGIFDSMKIGISSINEQFSSLSDEDFSTMANGAKVGFELVLDGVHGAIYGATYLVNGFSAVETGIEQLGLRGKSTFAHLEKYGIEAYVGIAEAYNVMMPDFLNKDIDLKDSRTKILELEKEITTYTNDYFKAEEDHYKITAATQSVLEKIATIKKRIKETGIVTKEDKKELEKLTKIPQKEYSSTLASGKVDTDQKLKDKYDSIIDKLNAVNNNSIENIEKKYKDISENLKETGMATNEDWSNLAKARNTEMVQSVISALKEWNSVLSESLKTVLNSMYKNIEDRYQPGIENYTKSANNLNFRSTSAASFGMTGVSLEYDYKAQLAQLNLQQTLNDKYYELSNKAKDYKKNIQGAMEVAGVVYATAASIGTILGGSGALDGIEFAINAQNLADDITGFQQYQSEYISGIETFKEQLRSLSETLVNISAAMYSSMDTYREYYDRLNTNSYSSLQILEAAHTLSPYTELNSTSISSFITDILKAQSGFITDGTTTAGADNETLLRSTELFSKYGLAIDSLNDKFMSSLDVITELIASQEKANKEIKEYGQSIRKNMVGKEYQEQYRRDQQINYLNALSQYRSGEITSSELISYAKSFEESLGAFDNATRQSLIDSLDGVSAPQSTEEYLKSLDDRVAQMQLVGMPVVNVDSMNSIDVQTLAAIEDTNSFLEKIYDLLQNPLGSDIVQAIIDAIYEGAKRIITSIAELPQKIGDAIKDAVNGVGDSASNAWVDIRDGISGVFGFSSGGYTGDGGVNEYAGPVHKGEYVIPQHMVRDMPGMVRYLESIRIGSPMQIANNTSFGKRIIAAPVSRGSIGLSNTVAQEINALRNELANANYELVKTSKKLYKIERDRRNEEVGVTNVSA